MQIQQINNCYSKQSTNPQFKSAYPTTFWVLEKGAKKYSIVNSRERSKHLGTVLVNMLNRSGDEIAIELQKLYAQKEKLQKPSVDLERRISRLELIKRVQRFISSRDLEYRYSKISRAFNTEGGFHKKKFDPMTYIVTGKDTLYIDDLGKEIGKKKAEVPSGYSTAEIEEKITEYWMKGLAYIKKRAKAFQKNGEPQELHVKVIAHRTKNGNLKSYEITNMEFFPHKCENHPLRQREWVEP